MALESVGVYRIAISLDKFPQKEMVTILIKNDLLKSNLFIKALVALGFLTFWTISSLTTICKLIQIQYILYIRDEKSDKDSNISCNIDRKLWKNF